MRGGRSWLAVTRVWAKMGEVSGKGMFLFSSGDDDSAELGRGQARG